MKSLVIRTNWKWIFFFTAFLSAKSTKIKVFHIYNSFGTETQELKNSIIMNYDDNGFLLDSTIFNHTLPLSEKYVYISGQYEGLKLQRSYDREMVLSYKFLNDISGNRIKTSLYGIGDTLYWNEFKKYDDFGNCIKRIRYNPENTVNPEMMSNLVGLEEMIWGESYDYDSTGTILEHKEIYDGYILEITTYKLDSTKQPIKIRDYFDPSVIVRTLYFYNETGKIIHESSSNRLGVLTESRSYSYDDLGNLSNTKVYDSNGQLLETINNVININDYKINEFIVDTTQKVLSEKETRLDYKKRPKVVAIIDGNNRLLEKKIFSYDSLERISEIREYDMLRRGAEDREIPIRVLVYEYD